MGEGANPLDHTPLRTRHTQGTRQLQTQPVLKEATSKQHAVHAVAFQPQTQTAGQTAALKQKPRRKQARRTTGLTWGSLTRLANISH